MSRGLRFFLDSSGDRRLDIPNDGKKLGHRRAPCRNPSVGMQISAADRQRKRNALRGMISVWV